MWTSFNRCESWSSMNLMTSSSEVSSFHKKNMYINVCFCCSCLQTCSSIYVIQVVRPLWTPSSPLSLWNLAHVWLLDSGCFCLFPLLTSPRALLVHQSYSRDGFVCAGAPRFIFRCCCLRAGASMFLRCNSTVNSFCNMFYGRVEIGFCLITVALAEIYVFIYLWS